MKITELITDTLLQLLDEQGGTIQIQRNDFASKIGCVPSQINYVITSRFTKEQGYIVESRRGGGGFIRIVKTDFSNGEIIYHIINSLGDQVDESTARIIINTLKLDGQLSEQQAKLMNACVSDDNFKGLDEYVKKAIRSSLLKSMLLNIF